MVVNAAPVPALTLDRGTGTAPHTATFDIAATDADGDRLSYELDYSDGQSATGVPPASLAHRYDATGAYTARLTVRDARTLTTTEAVVTVTDHGARARPLAAALHARRRPRHVHPRPDPRLRGHADRDDHRQRHAHPSATAAARPGFLVSDTTALRRPLEVRNTGGAFSPLSSAVKVPSTVEFRQRIEAGDVLRPGTYAKTLTFTLSVTGP